MCSQVKRSLAANGSYVTRYAGHRRGALRSLTPLSRPRSLADLYGIFTFIQVCCGSGNAIYKATSLATGVPRLTQPPNG